MQCLSSVWRYSNHQKLLFNGASFICYVYQITFVFMLSSWTNPLSDWLGGRQEFKDNEENYN